MQSSGFFFKQHAYVTIQLLLLAAISLMSTQTLASEFNFCLEPYIGMDAQARRMPFKKNFGDNVFQHRFYPEINMFAGLKFNDYLGFEAGYELSKHQKNTKRVLPGQIVFGAPIPSPDPRFNDVTNTNRTCSKLNGFNINLMGFLPIFCEEYNTQLIGSVGIASLNIKTRNTVTEIGSQTITLLNPTEIVPVQRIEANTSHYKSRKWTFRASTGIQYLTPYWLGIRALITWENTNKFKRQGTDFGTGLAMNEYAKLKNSLIYRIGAYIPF